MPTLTFSQLADMIGGTVVQGEEVMCVEVDEAGHAEPR